ncbi:hypothetical protein C8F01DRAFT_1152419 [Mycena amicta]|nr:hypothetical protein C8F01DRAFT_1152419 [Mycena amicta]
MTTTTTTKIFALCIDCAWKEHRLPTPNGGKCSLCGRWFVAAVPPLGHPYTPPHWGLPQAQYSPVYYTHLPTVPPIPQVRDWRAYAAPPQKEPPPPPPPPPPCPWPPIDTRPPQVVVPHSTLHGPAPTPIHYQTLTQLLRDLNCLLCAPHEGREFHFVGTYTIIAEVLSDLERQKTALEERVKSVAWEVVCKTPIALNVPDLRIWSSTDEGLPTARVDAPTTAMWTFSASPPPPCRRCFHIVEIQATSVGQKELDEVPGWAVGRRKMREQGMEPNVGAERIVLGLKHIPGVAAAAMTTTEGIAS